MFSFHKPKVYRSSTGCCICKAKSSSSRFTDSRKYEQDFLQCFQLATPRQGEICNACVLLVKRWKKLPAGSSRNWRHVVDARAGPGMKSMVKFKSKNKLNDAASERLSEMKIRRKKKDVSHSKREISPFLSDDNTTIDEISGVSNRADSPINAALNSDPEEVMDHNSREKTVQSTGSRCRLKGFKSRHRSPSLPVSSFLDMSFWKREYVCCGTVFIGPTGELLVDPRFLKPCSSHRKGEQVNNETNETNSTSSAVRSPESALSKSTLTLKSFSDSSSDSGYDESSNPGNENHRPEITESVEVVIDSPLTTIH
ncbi:SIN3-HDAC complex-associated factor [Chrysoperla carnea]|uniref:SIN3-HDAC complex-associated factor n=1 Tax=Chrysoperla carnea TaxID=189513 RepID=UPI001D0817FF|nr:SIN3-HDAC complex-associated factor [Chrysoperla carnea]